MRVPQWLTLGVAALVIIFGLYRLRMATRSASDHERATAPGKKGLFALPRRTHALIGVIYLLLGAALVATTFGWNPLGGMFAPSVPATPPTAPADPGAIRVEP
jgi:hypothetical protein